MLNLNLIYYLIAGSIFGALALKTGIPAAPLAGALIGASILSISSKVEPTEANRDKNNFRNQNWNSHWYIINKRLISRFLNLMETCYFDNFYLSNYGISNLIMDEQINSYRFNNNNFRGSKKVLAV